MHSGVLRDKARVESFIEQGESNEPLTTRVGFVLLCVCVCTRAWERAHLSIEISYK